MRSRRQHSQSVVEFGLLALLFTLILFAIADFGMLLNGWLAVSSSAREGARRASVGTHVTDTIRAAQNFAPVPGLSWREIKVLVVYGDCSGSCLVFCSSGATPPAGWPACDTTRSQTTYPPPPPVGPLTGTSVTVMVIADTFEVVTPLVRPFFGCPGSLQHCTVPLRSSTSMRYEGN
jgi:hypothetical protein